MIDWPYQILIALALDMILGDPRWLPHPVRAMGWLIRRAEGFTRSTFGKGKIAGLIMCLGVVSFCSFIAWGVYEGASFINPLFGDLVGILLIYQALAARDMVWHSEQVRKHLANENLPAARKAVSMIVGRDVNALDKPAVTRASIESVAENLVDGVISPLFYAVIFGPIGAVAFKAISTLDSMVGYRNERYLTLGWASARLDDFANYIPARLTAPIIALAASLIKLSSKRTLLICLRDRTKHTSPNSAWSEASFAGALGVQLGGAAIYGNQIVEHPTLGDDVSKIEPKHIQQANCLFMITVLLAAGLFIGCMILFANFFDGIEVAL